MAWEMSISAEGWQEIREKLDDRSREARRAMFSAKMPVNHEMLQSRFPKPFAKSLRRLT